MSVKLPMVSICALVLLAVIISVAIAVSKSPPRSKYDSPEKITVLLEKRSEIVTLDFEDFVVGCMFGMANPKHSAEALNSAACAISTTALYHLENIKGFEYCGADISDAALPYLPPESAKKLYGDKYDKYRELFTSAAQYGMSHVVLYEGAPICAACCAISTGYTDSYEDVAMSGKPYLKGVSAEYDKEADGYISTTALTSEMVRKALREAAPEAVLSGHPEEWFTSAEYSNGGTLTSVDYGGVTLSGAQLKKLLKLRSSAIAITYENDRLVFTCKGCGDNLGMSLYSANALALRGKTADEILTYFYTGCEVVELCIQKAPHLSEAFLFYSALSS